MPELLDNEIDRLMSLLPDELLNEPPSSIDSIIAYYRRQREGGAKATKDTGAPKIDLAKLGIVAAKVEAPIKRRF